MSIEFKKIEHELVSLNYLTNCCGFFTSETNLNNGYGCIFPIEGEVYKKQEPGCCFGFDCPLAWVADLEDLKKHDLALYEEYKDAIYRPDECGSDWMIQYREVERGGKYCNEQILKRL